MNVDEVVGHGLVGELVEDGTDGVEASLHYQQLGLGLLLSQSETNTPADITKVREEEGRKGGHPGEHQCKKNLQFGHLTE